MPFDRPTNIELVSAVKEFLEAKVLPELKGHLNFNTRVSINVLKILERELDQGEAITREAAERLTRLLKSDEHNVRELNNLLCEDIDKGKLTYENQELVDHLWITTLDKLSVDNPRYASYQQVIAK